MSLSSPAGVGVFKKLICKLCSSLKYPYFPHGMDLFYENRHFSGNVNLTSFFTTILHHANRNVVDVDRGVSLCKLSREYFLLWVINTSLYGNTNTSTLPVCTNKTWDKSLHNK